MNNDAIVCDAIGLPKSFPDVQSCRVEDIGFGGFYKCSSPWRALCPHTLSFSSDLFCRHLDVKKILPRLKRSDAVPLLNH
jgi:hypothetical protein